MDAFGEGGAKRLRLILRHLRIDVAAAGTELDDELARRGRIVERRMTMDGIAVTTLWVANAVRARSFAERDAAERPTASLRRIRRARLGFIWVRCIGSTPAEVVLVVSKRDDLVPFGRHKAERWTRICDYVEDAEAQLRIAPPRADLPGPREKRVSRRGLWLPIYALGIAAAALWASGAMQTIAPDGAEGAQQGTGIAAASVASVGGTTSSKGLVFGLCDQGGGTNCVVDGDSFFIGGKGIQVAGIDAPETHSARCDAEALLGWAATERLHGALNSGTVETVPVEPGLDANGRLLRTVKIDGRNIAGTLIAAGLARPSRGTGATWC